MDIVIVKFDQTGIYLVKDNCESVSVGNVWLLTIAYVLTDIFKRQLSTMRHMEIEVILIMSMFDPSHWFGSGGRAAGPQGSAFWSLSTPLLHEALHFLLHGCESSVWAMCDRDSAALRCTAWICVWMAAKLNCKALWVVIKLRKALYKNRSLPLGNPNYASLTKNLLCNLLNWKNTTLYVPQNYTCRNENFKLYQQH